MQFFQREFTITSVIKFYPKMWESWVHPDCNHFYILYELPNKATSSHKPTFFSGNNNPLSIEPTVVWIKIPKKGTSVFLVLNLFTFFKKGKTMVPKYQHLMQSRLFPDKFNRQWFYKWSSSSMWCSAVVACDVPLVKILL